MLGFHDYKPVNGLYWEYRYIDYEILTPELAGVNTLKLYECSRCGKVKSKIIEIYSKPSHCTIGFNINQVIDLLESEGIKHINKFYAK